MNSLRSDRAAIAFRCRLIQQVQEANVTGKHRTLPEQCKKRKGNARIRKRLFSSPPPLCPSLVSATTRIICPIYFLRKCLDTALEWDLSKSFFTAIHRVPRSLPSFLQRAHNSFEGFSNVCVCVCVYRPTSLGVFITPRMINRCYRRWFVLHRTVYVCAYDI